MTDEKRTILGETLPDECRRDVAEHFQVPAMFQCGWTIFLSRSALSGGDHFLSAYIVDADTRIAYRLRGTYPVTGDGSDRSSWPVAAIAPENGNRPSSPEENDRVNLREQTEGKAVLTSYPASMELELTHRCNLNCVMCYRYNTDLNADISDHVYGLVKEAVFPRAREVTFSGRGEPILYSKWDEVAREVATHGFHRIVVTNATTLNEKRIRQLVEDAFEVHFSVDGATSRTYQYVRGADLSTVAAHIRECVSALRSSGNRAIRTSVSLTPMLFNIREIPDMVDLIAEWGVDDLCIQKFMPLNPYATEHWAPEADAALMERMCEEAARRAEYRNVTFRVAGVVKHRASTSSPMKERIAASGHLRCSRPFWQIFVYLNGAVTPCCYGAPCMGHLPYQSFDEIWNGETWCALRRALAEGNPPDYCRRCHMLHEAGKVA